MRSFQESIRIDKYLSLEEIKEILSDYQFYENDIFSNKYRSKISIAIWKDCIVLYPLEGCKVEFINEIRERLEKEAQEK